MKTIIPLSVPNISGNEWKYIQDCLDTGWVSSAGSYVGRFEQSIASFTGAAHGIACVNGTAALHLALQLAGVKRGDYVLVPNITFVASCNSIHYTGADPLLVDIDPDTWQMDLTLLESFLESKTYQEEGLTYHTDDQRCIRAIMPVHVLGNMCDMDKLQELARTYNLIIVEDSTEALGSTYRGQHAGTFGMFGTFSFNGNKIITTGGGGMIVTQDEALAKHAKHLTTQAKTSPSEYIHDEVGYNYRLVNLLAAMGVAQMELLPGFLERKKEIDRRYREALEPEHYIFQKITPHVTPNHWLQTMKVKDQQAMIRHLNDHGIECRPFWVPMNELQMYQHVPYVTHQHVAQEVYRHCISIPSSTNLTDEQVTKVIDVIRSFRD